MKYLGGIFMKNYKIENEILNIKKLISFEESVFFRKITPKFFSHDEDEYHIESKVAITLNYIDDSDKEIEKIIEFYKEHQIEYIGQEVEVEIEEFVELLEETPEFIDAKSRLGNVKLQIANDFTN